MLPGGWDPGQPQILHGLIQMLLPLFQCPDEMAGEERIHREIGELPDVPTIHEAGYPKVDSTFVQFRGIVAPKGTPADRLAKINDAFIKTMKTERIVKWLNKTGKTPMNYGPEKFTKFAEHMDEVTAHYVKDLGGKKK